jgi:hypothetical protein
LLCGNACWPKSRWLSPKRCSSSPRDAALERAVRWQARPRTALSQTPTASSRLRCVGLPPKG